MSIVYEFTESVRDYETERKQRRQFLEEPMQVSWIQRVNWWRVFGLIVLPLVTFGGLVYLWLAGWLF